MNRNYSIAGYTNELGHAQDKEEIYTQAAKEFNELIEEYTSQTTKTREECIALAGFEMAVHALTREHDLLSLKKFLE